MEKDVLDDDLTRGGFSATESPPAISVLNFSLLYLLTFGVYPFWWVYKVWRYLAKQRQLEIWPAARAFFSVIFLYSLLEHIQREALRAGYTKSYSSGFLFLLFIVFNFSSRLPGLLFLISFLGLIVFIQPVRAVNYITEQLFADRDAIPYTFNRRQIVLMFFGLLFWALVLFGLYQDPTLFD